MREGRCGLDKDEDRGPGMLRLRLKFQDRTVRRPEKDRKRGDTWGFKTIQHVTTTKPGR